MNRRITIRSHSIVGRAKVRPMSPSGAETTSATTPLVEVCDGSGRPVRPLRYSVLAPYTIRPAVATDRSFAGTPSAQCRWHNPAFRGRRRADSQSPASRDASQFFLARRRPQAVHACDRSRWLVMRFVRWSSVSRRARQAPRPTGSPPSSCVSATASFEAARSMSSAQRGGTRCCAWRAVHGHPAAPATARSRCSCGAADPHRWARAAINRVRLDARRALRQCRARRPGTGHHRPADRPHHRQVPGRVAGGALRAPASRSIRGKSPGWPRLAGQSLAWLRGAHDGGNVLQMLQRLPIGQVEAIAARIAQEPDVDYAQPDYIRTAQLVPTDPCYASAEHRAAAAVTSGTCSTRSAASTCPARGTSRPARRASTLR